MNADWSRYEIGLILGWACVGIGRGWWMRRRGVKVLSPDPERTRADLLVDVATGLGLLMVFWEVLAYSVPVPFHFGLGFLGVVLWESSVAALPGLILQGLSLGVYGRALFDLGTAWRLGIDRGAPGELVTRGIYRWCRHPIYVAFDLYVVGSCLAMGRAVFVPLLLLLPPLLHLQMLREERFLAERYGDAYREYRNRVRRYGVW